MSQFNFFSEIHYQEILYSISMSVDINDVVHLAKTKTSTENTNIKKRLDAFVQFAENKNVFTLDKFFQENKTEQEFDPILYAYQRGILHYTGEAQIIKNKCKTDPLICACSGLTKKEVITEKNKTVFNMENLVKETKAGTGCGSCRADLKKIMTTYEQMPLLTAASYVRLWESMEMKGEFICRCKKVPATEIAELLEKSGSQKGLNLYKDLQTKYGIGLSCNLCESNVKQLLA